MQQARGFAFSFFYDLNQHCRAVEYQFPAIRHSCIVAATAPGDIGYS
jgi:hypothetical protein